MKLLIASIVPIDLRYLIFIIQLVIAESSYDILLIFGTHTI